MNSERHSPNSSPFGNTLIAFIAGLIVGLAIALVVAWMITRNAPQEKQNVRPPEVAVVPKPNTNGENAEPRDINSPLKGKSNKSEDADKPASSEAPTKQSEKTTSYWLQIGAYANRGDAESQKAAVAMQGIQAVISEHTVDEKKLWRVRIGPFATSQDVLPTKGKLEDASIAYSVIKVNK
jgi:cell division protein FtsN